MFFPGFNCTCILIQVKVSNLTFSINLIFICAIVKASGVAVAAECKESFEDVKKGKQHRYIIFYIEDEKMIKVESVGDRNADYDQVFKALSYSDQNLTLRSHFL